MVDRTLTAQEAYSEKNLHRLETLLGIEFRNKTYLVTSLSHRSSTGDLLFSKEENKKLALIGDALIDLVVFSFLYPNVTPEIMDGVRQTLATNPKLNTVAKRLGLQGYMFLEDSVNEVILNQSISFGADTVEALTGAIFMDRCFEAASKFVKEFVLPDIVKTSQ